VCSSDLIKVLFTEASVSAFETYNLETVLFGIASLSSLIHPAKMNEERIQAINKKKVLDFILSSKVKS
jgi:hypothetical protein